MIEGISSLRGLPVAQAKAGEAKKRQVVRDTVEAVREAVTKGRFLLGLYYLDGGRLEQRIFRADFPSDDFGKIEEHFRSFLSGEVRRQRSGVEPPELRVLDELLDDIQPEPASESPAEEPVAVDEDD